MPENTEEVLQVRFRNPAFSLAELKAIFSDLDWLGKYAADMVLNDYRDYEPSETRGRPRLPSLRVRSVHSGSLVLEIKSDLAAPAGSGAAILAILNRLLKHGPELVALPHRMRESWFAAAHDAELAKQKLRRLERYGGTIETSGPELDEADIDNPLEIPVRRTSLEIEGSEVISARVVLQLGMTRAYRP